MWYGAGIKEGPHLIPDWREFPGAKAGEKQTPGGISGGVRVGGGVEKLEASESKRLLGDPQRCGSR